MAGSVNKVILVGNLGKDPEVRRMQDGRPVEGTAETAPHLGQHSVQVQLFEAPNPILPPKAG